MRKIRSINDILDKFIEMRKSDISYESTDSKSKYTSINPDDLSIGRYDGICYDYAEAFAKIATAKLGYTIYNDIELEKKSLALFMFRVYDKNWLYAKKTYGFSTYYSHVWVQIRNGNNKIKQIEQFPTEDPDGGLHTTIRVYKTYEESLDCLFKKYKNFVNRRIIKEEEKRKGIIYAQLFQYKPFFLKNQFGLTQSQLIQSVVKRGRLVREEAIL